MIGVEIMAGICFCLVSGKYLPSRSSVRRVTLVCFLPPFLLARMTTAKSSFSMARQSVSSAVSGALRLVPLAAVADFSAAALFFAPKAASFFGTPLRAAAELAFFVVVLLRPRSVSAHSRAPTRRAAPRRAAQNRRKAQATRPMRHIWLAHFGLVLV